MVQYELWGNKVDIEIPEDKFPNEARRQELDEIFDHPEHGYMEGTYQGKKLYYRKHLPKNGQKPKAIIIWTHGIHGESGFGMKCQDGRYTNFALRVRKMTQAGYAVYAMDQLGHGFSEGARFLIPKGDWTINRNDYIKFAKMAASEFPDTPLFLIGDSYGGCLTLHVARWFQDHPDDKPKMFKGILLNCPSIDADLPSKPVVAILRRLAVFFPLWTPFFMPHPVSSERIWKELEPRKYFSDKDDGLSKGGKPFCLGTALGLLLALESVQKDVCPGFDIPFSINHGTDDVAVPISGSEYLMEHCATSDATLNKIEGGFHDMYSQLDAEDILAKEMTWIEAHLTK